MRIYLDTSALVKLVVRENETDSLRKYLRHHPDDSSFSSALARTELIRAVGPSGSRAIADAKRLLEGLDLVVLSPRLLDDAGVLQPARLRSLDAIHLVSAQRARDGLRTVISYDVRMLAAAEELGIPAASPR